MDQHAFRGEQRKIFFAIFLANVVTILGILFVINYLPRVYTNLSRLTYLSLSLLGPFLTLVGGIGYIAKIRFFHQEIANPLDGGQTVALQIGSQYCQNTLEQFVLVLFVYPILSLYLPSRHILLIALFSGLFILGRVLFRLGYGRGPGGRAFGFALTFYPTLYALGVGFFYLYRTIN